MDPRKDAHSHLLAKKEDNNLYKIQCKLCWLFALRCKTSQCQCDVTHVYVSLCCSSQREARVSRGVQQTLVSQDSSHQQSRSDEVFGVHYTDQAVFNVFRVPWDRTDVQTSKCPAVYSCPWLAAALKPVPRVFTSGDLDKTRDALINHTLKSNTLNVSKRLSQAVFWGILYEISSSLVYKGLQKALNSVLKMKS